MLRSVVDAIAATLRPGRRLGPVATLRRPRGPLAVGSAVAAAVLDVVSTSRLWIFRLPLSHLLPHASSIYGRSNDGLVKVE